MHPAACRVRVTIPCIMSTRYTFSRTMRLSGDRQFASVFAAKMKKNAGPLSVHAKINGLNHPRLGLSVSRRVGGAVTRNRVKRLLREAFRLQQHDSPRGYDIVVVVRPHDLVTLADYQRLLSTAIRAIHLEWDRRLRREQDDEGKPSPSSE